MQALQLAQRRNDTAEVEQINAKLAQLLAANPHHASRHSDETTSDILAKVNERNRKANLETIRKAEHLEAERRRRERKLAGANGTATPPADRLKSKALDSRLVASSWLSLTLRLCNLLLTRTLCLIPFGNIADQVHLERQC